MKRALSWQNEQKNVCNLDGVLRKDNWADGKIDGEEKKKKKAEWWGIEY